VDRSKPTTTSYPVTIAPADRAQAKTATIRTVSRLRGAIFVATLIALALLLLAVAITLVVNGPINLEQQEWNTQAPPADWARVRDRRQIARAVRTVALRLALGCLNAPPRSKDARP
jgi:hypothetical protein